MSGHVNTIRDALTDIADFEEQTAGGVGNLTGDALTALDDLRVDLEKAQSAVSAWRDVFECIEAHLKDRIAMGDESDPRRYLEIIRAEVTDVNRGSERIVAARWADAARYRAEIDRLKSSNAELLAALQTAASALEAVAELTWDKRQPDATRNACDEATVLAGGECETARVVIAKATGAAP